MTPREFIPPEDRKPLTKKQRAEITLRQNGRCYLCGSKLQPGHIVDEHLVPLWSGGSNALSNRALVCSECAKKKTRDEAKRLAKTRRLKKTTLGASKGKKPFPGGRNSKFKKKMNGSVVVRE